MALVDIKVPDIGDFDEVAVIELLVKAGDVVKAEQSLITVENGFSRESSETIYEGASFMSTIDTLHTKWKKENGYA